MAESQSQWATLFRRWPAEVPTKGIVTDTHGESNPFKGFMLAGDMLLLERSNPDALGARFIMLSFESISAVKLTEPLKADVFRTMGFEGKFSL